MARNTQNIHVQSSSIIYLIVIYGVLFKRCSAKQCIVFEKLKSQVLRKETGRLIIRVVLFSGRCRNEINLSGSVHALVLITQIHIETGDWSPLNPRDELLSDDRHPEGFCLHLHRPPPDPPAGLAQRHTDISCTHDILSWDSERELHISALLKDPVHFTLYPSSVFLLPIQSLILCVGPPRPILSALLIILTVETRAEIP